MNKVHTSATIIALVLTLVEPAFAFDGWHLENATMIESKTSTFDYITYDAGTNMLFTGHRTEGLQAYDPSTKKLVKVIGDTLVHSSNGATLMPEFDLGVSNNSDGTLTPFKISTLAAQASVKVSTELDTSHYDPFSKRLFVTGPDNKDGQDLVVVDVPSLKIAGTIVVPTKSAEGADADGKGHLYQTAQREAKILVIDTKSLKVTSEWPTPGCAKPTSVVTDVANNRLYVGCRSGGETKPAFLVMKLDDGKVIYTAEIGDGVDSIVYDADLKRIFIPGGVNATLSVFEQINADSYKPLETLATRQWVRVMAMDHKSKKLYSTVAEGSADAAKKIITAVSPYYPNTVFPNTFTFLTYSK